jgi:2,4-dienoyl-CoA reductase-like NADH-dependent reductase (Old Yellow Enzyme family)
MMEKMFEPITIGNLELKNRFMRSATWDATADEIGAVTDMSVELYRRLGEGDIGLIVSGFAFVSVHGQARPGQYGIYSDDMIPGLRRMVKAAQQNGSKVAVQIVHAGNKSPFMSERGIQSLAMSYSLNNQQPYREMTEEDIEGIIDDFATAAVRAREAGFDAIQIHSAHGFLLSQAESPLLNLRTDRWGGSPENRRRFHLKVIQRVRKAIGNDFPLIIKYGVMDDQVGGLKLEEGIETARQMIAAGIEAIEVSAGVGQVYLVTREGDPEQTPFRERGARLKNEVSVPVMLVNGIRTFETAKDIIDSGDADMVSMCRPFMREPGLLVRWQRGEKAPATCISCGLCLPKPGHCQPIECYQERRLIEGVSKKQ